MFFELGTVFTKTKDGWRERAEECVAEEGSEVLLGRNEKNVSAWP
jgi:hypothetical protein